MSNQLEDQNKKENTKQADELLENLIQTEETDQVIERTDKDHLLIDKARYEVIEDYNEALDLEKLESRYSDLLEKYDYIVGDISKDQLRLRGFYEDDGRQVPIDMKITYLEDYLTEYCSFGASYFVLKRLDPPKNFMPYKKDSRPPRRKRSKPSNRKARGKGASDKNRPASKKPRSSNRPKPANKPRPEGKPKSRNKQQAPAKPKPVTKSQSSSKPKSANQNFIKKERRPERPDQAPQKRTQTEEVKKTPQKAKFKIRRKEH